MKKYRYVVSACLAGQNCKYNGGSNPCHQVMEMVKNGVVLPICPETLAELPRPRQPAEQRGDKVFSRCGEELTEKFNEGSQKALELALQSGARKAILKSNSPSCGYRQIYDGTFSHTLKAGHGTWTKKLLQCGFEIFTEKNLPTAGED